MDERDCKQLLKDVDIIILTPDKAREFLASQRENRRMKNANEAVAEGTAPTADDVLAALDDESREILTVSSPLLFSISLYQFFIDVSSNK